VLESYSRNSDPVKYYSSKQRCTSYLFGIKHTLRCSEECLTAWSHVCQTVWRIKWLEFSL